MGCGASRSSTGPTSADVQKPAASKATPKTRANNGPGPSREIGGAGKRTPIANKELGASGLATAGDSSDSDPGTPPANRARLSVPVVARAPLGPTVENEPIAFTLDELQRATGGFCRKIGEGGFGVVFLGALALPLSTGGSEVKEIAVKVLKHRGGEFKSWQSEVRFLGPLRHQNLVPLYGYCYEGEDWMLVYEYMANGSFEDHLFPAPGLIDDATNVRILGLQERLKVMTDAARGLVFLHEECGKIIVYRDFKTGNILLDKDFVARLSDFGMARDGPDGPATHVSTSGIAGTMGYMAPEYISKGHVSPKCDVYSYGVVLLEVVSGKKVAHVPKLVVWARKATQSSKEGWRQVVEPKLETEYPQMEMAAKHMIKAALTCVRPDPRDRPTMRAVLESLTAVLEQDAQTLGDGVEQRP